MRKSQVAFEHLILLGIVIMIILITVLFSVKPKEEIVVDQAESSLDTIVEYANQVAELGPGNRVKFKVEISPAVSSIDFGESSIRMVVNEDSPIENVINKPVAAPMTGFRFLGENNELQPGNHDIVCEAMGAGVCCYPPAERDTYCYCFAEDSDLETPQFIGVWDSQPLDPTVLCAANGNPHQECDDTDNQIIYGDLITELSSRCVDEQLEPLKNARVVYTISNWTNETVYEEEIYETDKWGYFNLSGVNYIIENSGPVMVDARCYHECYDIRQEEGHDITLLSDETRGTIHVPYGQIVAFLLDEFGNRLYEEDIGNNHHMNLIGPDDNINRWWLPFGWVKGNNAFVIRTGYECRGGECVRVNASLFHGTSNP